MAEIALKWNLGIDNIATKTNLPLGSVADAVNVDIDRAATLGRRDGYSVVVSDANAHDVWTSESRGQSFIIFDGALCHITMPWSLTTLHTLQQDAPFFYEDLNGDVVCGSRHETLVIAPDLSVRRLGLERPDTPRVSAATTGGLTAGDYSMAISYLRGYEEGPLSRMANVTLAEGGGLTITVPQPTESLPTKVRVHRTNADGDKLFRAADIAVGVTSFTLGVTDIGKQATKQFTDRMIPGDFVRYWRGMLWVVRGNFAFYSESMDYGVYSPRFNFVPMQNAIRMFEPVETGIFIGTRDGIFFLSGKTPQEFEVIRLGGTAPVKGTSRRIPVALLSEEGDSREYGGEYAVVWLSQTGFVVGKSDGNIVEKQRRHITLSGVAGAVVVHKRKVVATVVS